MIHNYRSGLLEHILSMSRSALTLARLYKLDRDLILTGILVHDIGILREINYDYESTLTKDGNLIGHLVISRDIVLEEANKIKKFPKGLLIKIEHIISQFLEIIFPNLGNYFLKICDHVVACSGALSGFHRKHIFLVR